jgi:(1->4)-alpha-D-glucan 1-alpha-D-glucosylmutase
LRREHPALFAEGSYEPVAVTGALADRLVAFARRHDSDIAITIVPRLPYALLGQDDRITFDSSAWNDTALAVGTASPIVWCNIFDDQAIHGTNGKVAAKSIFHRCPVALLMAAR